VLQSTRNLGVSDDGLCGRNGADGSNPVGRFGLEPSSSLPEHHDVIVDKSHGDAPEREHVLVAIREAFDAAVRQIEDVERHMRGQVKQHVGESHGRVAKFMAGEDYGFIEAVDGSEVYFHRNAIVDGDFERLTVGSEVRFVEEEGDKGAQASAVRLVGKRHSV